MKRDMCTVSMMNYNRYKPIAFLWGVWHASWPITLGKQNVKLKRNKACIQKLKTIRLWYDIIRLWWGYFCIHIRLNKNLEASDVHSTTVHNTRRKSHCFAMWNRTLSCRLTPCSKNVFFFKLKEKSKNRKRYDCNTVS